MPIHFQEIEEEDHHHHQDHHNHRHAEEDRSNPQTSPPRPPQQRQKTTTESSTRKLLCIFFKCIIMGFVLSLFLLFIGFAALVLLHFLLTTTAGRRRRRHHHQQYPQFSTDPISVSYSREDLLELLPHLSYAASAQTARDCAICLESFKEGDVCRKLPDCRHLFHVNCVDTWLTKVPNCPICRTRVRLDSGASSSMNSDDEWKVWWPVAFEDGNVAI